jgi:low affinity Fe/Cu permease
LLLCVQAFHRLAGKPGLLRTCACGGDHVAAQTKTRNRSSGRKRERPTRGRRLSLVDRFREASDRLTDKLGTPWAVLAALALIVVWVVTGPVFGFSDTWQLVINTATTVITFLMVFVIQTSQNRQSKAIQFKLDELIRANPRARNEMIEAERESTDELHREEEEFQRVAERGGERDVPPQEHAEKVHDRSRGKRDR